MRITKLLITSGLVSAGLLAGAVAPATAQEATSDAWMDRPATKTRAQVLAELEMARDDGTIHAVSTGYDFVGAHDGSKTRDRVLAERRRARMSGTFDAIDAEAWDYVPVSQIATASRERRP